MNNAELAEKEYRKLREWAVNEEMRISESLKKEGRHRSGLDGQKEEEFARIDEKFKRGIQEIRKKYGLCD